MLTVAGAERYVSPSFVSILASSAPTCRSPAKDRFQDRRRKATKIIWRV
jgi:hypothetical protein